MTENKTKRYLSGVQPSGNIHIGNYFGAIKNHIDLQEAGDSFYFIANYHALTTIKDKALLSANTLDVASTYFALGLDPEKAVFWVQSDVPEVTELTWILSTVTGMGLLERAVSYKDKIAKGLKASVGLFNYPVLMASDILIFKSDIVPVGKDQIQHIEMCQDMANTFNQSYSCDVLVRPEWAITKTPKVPGTDGQKMSKSYGNTIPVFASKKQLKKAVMSIATDSKTLEESKDPDTCNVVDIYKLFASDDEVKDLAEKYRAGNYGYGHAKLELLSKIESYFEPFKERKEALIKDQDYVRDALSEGAKKARAVARQTLLEVREACGLKY